MEDERHRFSKGEWAYIVISSRWIRQARVISVRGNLYTVRFFGGGGTCVKESRLYRTKYEAEKMIHAEPEKTRGFCNPHMYGEKYNVKKRSKAIH